MVTTESTNSINVLGAPIIPGLTFRSFQGETDFPKMAAVIRDSQEADQAFEVQTAEDIALEYAHIVHCDPYKDMLFAEIACDPNDLVSKTEEDHHGFPHSDGKVIGYTRVYWFDQMDGPRIYQ